MQNKPKPPHAGLRMMVISLGVLLVGGVIVLFGAVAAKVGKPKDHGCTLDAMLDLSAEGEILSARWDGPLLRLMAQAPDGGYRLLTLDSCSGEIVGRVALRAEGLPAAD